MNKVHVCVHMCHTPGRWQSKTSILSKNIDKKSLEIEFSIAICRPSVDKWQSKTLFLSIFDQHSSLLRVFLIAPYPVCASSLVRIVYL